MKNSDLFIDTKILLGRLFTETTEKIYHRPKIYKILATPMYNNLQRIFNPFNTELIHIFN